MITDMTKGSISRHLIGFSVPRVLGNLYQLTNNAVDLVILGRFAGEQSLAAVGTASLLDSYAVGGGSLLFLI